MIRRLPTFIFVVAAAVAVHAANASQPVFIWGNFLPNDTAAHAQGQYQGGADRNYLYCEDSGVRTYTVTSVGGKYGNIRTVYSDSPAGLKVAYWLASKVSDDVYYDRPSARKSSGEQTYNVTSDGSSDPIYVGARFDYISYGIRFDGNGGTGSMPTLSGIIYTNSFAMLSNVYVLTGCSFVGWRDGAGHTFTDRQIVSGSDFGVVDDGTNVLLRAEWSTNDYTATFILGNGNPNVVKRQKYATALVAPTPTRPGYAFAGWSPTVPANMPAENVTFTARWTAYVITYYTQGGSACANGSGKVTLPSTARTGYTFRGWYTAASGGTRVGGSGDTYAPSSNMALYAQWNANTYKVTFGKNGGTGGDDYVTATYGVAMPTPRTAPKKPGYTFDGYWDTTNAGGKQYYDVDMKSVRNWDKTTATTLWAKWVAYAVAYNTHGGSACANGSGEVTLPSTTRTGYTFNGWFTAASGGIRVGGAGETYAPTASITLHAQWTANRYKVTFGKNGGTGGDDYVTATYGAAMPTPRTAPKRSGYTFGGYWDTTNSGGKQYYDADMKSVRSWDKAMAVTLWAKWTPNTYMATFGKNGGIGGADTVTVTYGASMPSGSAPTRTGYTFDGYWTTTGTGGVQYYDADMKSVRNWDRAASTTLWAKWTPNTYTVRFNANGGKSPTESTAVTYDSAYGNLPTPTKAGYSFSGWYTAASGGTEVTSSTTVSTADDHTLYAHWGVRTYTLTIGQSTGSGTGSISPPVGDHNYEYGTNVVLKATPGENSYFVGWSDGEMAAERSVEIVSNILLRAEFTAYAPCHVVFNANGGEELMSSVDVICEKSTALPSNSFTRTGYAFQFWTNAVYSTSNYLDGASVTFERRLSGTEMVFYAVWQPNSYVVRYNANGGFGEMDDQQFVYDMPQPLSQCAFDPPEPGASFWDFAGWSNKTDNVFYESGAMVSNLTTEANGVVELVAIWSDARPELSIAMHCENLVWTNVVQGLSSNDGWGACYADGIGYDGADSCVTNVLSISMMAASVSTNGVLSFCAKCSSGEEGIDFFLSAELAASENWMRTNFTVNTEWQEFVIPIVGPSSDVPGWLKIWQSRPNRTAVIYIDRMTWVPEGATVEPTAEDVRDITDITVADGGVLMLSFTDADERFSYNLHGTNDLSVIRSLWPVLWTTNGTGTITIVPPVSPSESKFFYYLETTSR